MPIFYQETWTEEKTTGFPATSDNPMKPLFCKHPLTGESVQVHYNDKNLMTDKDYQDAGLEYINGKGWCKVFHT